MARIKNKFAILYIMKDFRYTSIDRVLSKLGRDLGSEDEFEESDVIEWAGEALELIDAVNQYESALAFIEVKNYTACLPNGMYMLHQVVRNTCWTGPTDDPLCPQKVIDDLSVVTEDPTNLPIALDCNGQPLHDYELAYYRPYFDLQAEAPFVNSACGFLSGCYTPIRQTSNNFFDSVALPLDDKLYQGGADEYSFIDKGRALRLSFAEGSIAIAYDRVCVDENGYPMIPDHASYITAISKYITYRIMEKRFYRNERGSDSRMQKAENDWHWYCKQAGNLALMIRGEDDHQDMLEQRLHMLPKLKRYYGFFGKMNKAEGRKFNDPDNRNNNYFRGTSYGY